MFQGTDMCDFPIGYFLPGQLSRNRGSTDKPHLVQIKHVRNRNAENLGWTVIGLLQTLRLLKVLNEMLTRLYLWRRRPERRTFNETIPLLTDKRSSLVLLVR